MLRTHLRMTGSWHVYREGEHWRKPGLPRPRRGRAPTAAGSAVCFQAPVVETYHQAGRRARCRSPGWAPTSASPTSLDDAVLDAVLERAAPLSPAGTTLGEALLDQRIAAGIGNVYKSEACFAVGVDPGTPIERVDKATPPRPCGGGGPPAPVEPRPRRAPHPSRRPGRLRAARASRAARCSTPVRMTRHGDLARSSYWCPACQPAPDPDASP